MTVSEFAVKVTEREGKKKQTDIAQVKEVLKSANDLLGGALYRIIRVS